MSTKYTRHLVDQWHALLLLLLLKKALVLRLLGRKHLNVMQITGRENSRVIHDQFEKAWRRIDFAGKWLQCDFSVPTSQTQKNMS